MILTIVFLGAVFVVTRMLLTRAHVVPAVANSVGSAIVGAFLFGSLLRPFGVPDAPPAAAPVTTPASPTASPAPDTPVPTGDVRDVSKACTEAHPKLVKTTGTIGVFDAFGAVGGGAQVATQATIPRDVAYKAIGWGYDPNGVKPAVAACLSVDGKLLSSVVSQYGLLREDVAQAAKDQALGPTGFAMTVAANTLPLGRHTLAVWIKSHDGTYSVLRHSWILTIR